MNRETPLAIITGGTSGIGLATARKLAERYRLALVFSRDADRAQAIESDFGSPNRVKTFRIDVGSDESVNAGYPEIVAHFEAQPQVLVNSAGVAQAMQFFVQGRNLRSCVEQMNINFFGTLRMVQKALPGMYSRRQGSIINLSSICARGGYRGTIGYSESKAAIAKFTENLALEVGHRGVVVNCVSPGHVQTPMWGDALTGYDQKSINSPLGRPITAVEVADVIEFLVSYGPAINGQNITIDGGTSLEKLPLTFAKFDQPTGVTPK